MDNLKEFEKYGLENSKNDYFYYKKKEVEFFIVKLNELSIPLMPTMSSGQTHLFKNSILMLEKMVDTIKKWKKKIESVNLLCYNEYN